jgi:tripartite-type tricarboxylate transporter receptor subunit TctC
MSRSVLASLVSAGFAACALVLAPSAAAQSDRAPYRILVGFPAGGTIDVVARILADEMKEDLGAPVVVDSRPGAGGQLAAQALLQAPADGRTLLLSPDHTMVMLSLTVKSPGFKPATDFAPVGQVARYAGPRACFFRLRTPSSAPQRPTLQLRCRG